jgi:hypothetical protein
VQIFLKQIQVFDAAIPRPILKKGWFLFQEVATFLLTNPGRSRRPVYLQRFLGQEKIDMSASSL